jgi:hypothetical protein
MSLTDILIRCAILVLVLALLDVIARTAGG